MSVAKPILDYIRTIKTQAQVLRSTGMFKRLLAYHKRYWPLVIFVIGLGILGAFLFTLEPLFTAQIIDLVEGSLQGKIQFNPGQLQLLIISIVVVIVSFGILNFINTYVQGYLAQMVTRDLRSDYYSKLQRKSFKFFDASAVGDLVSRATMDMQAVEAFVRTWLGTVTNAIFVLVIAFAIMYSVSPIMSLIALAPMPLVFYFQAQLWIKTMPMFRKMMLILGRLGAYIQQNIIGMKVVRIFQREDELDEGFKQVEKEFVETAIAAGKIQSYYMPTASAIVTLGIVAVYIYGGNLIAAPAAILTIGDLTLFARYMMRMSFPLRDLSMLSGNWINAAAGLERIYQIMDIPEDADTTVGNGPRLASEGEVEFNNVTFGYTKERPVLKNISFKVKPGEKIAILGATGSGKTSLVYLIPRFYDPDSGVISIDGVDVRDYRLSELRRQVGLVLQDVFIFTGTLKDNIAFGSPNATPREIESAARLARIHDFIATLPDGYDTIVGERGITLSGGQRQRITIARALLASPKILILDDALSFVDAKTEHEIQLAIEEAMKGKTAFIIAQRLSTIKNADRIMVMDDGKIVEFGTHRDLMAKDTVYKRIYETQFMQKWTEKALEATAR